MDDMKGSYLENHQKEVSQCVKCGICQAGCPTYEATGDESMVARGRLALIESVLEGELEFSEGVAERLSKCTSCLSCVTNCPRGIDPVKIINAAKGEFVARNGSDFISKIVFNFMGRTEKSLYPMFKLLGMAGNMFYNHIPAEGWLKEVLPFVKNGIKKSFPQFGKRNFKDEVPDIINRQVAATKWSYRSGEQTKKTCSKNNFLQTDSIKVGKPQMRVLFFSGCMTDFVYQDAGHSLINLLRKHGNIEIIVPKNIGCCGAPAYYMGDHKTAIKLAEKNYRILSDINPDFIIVNCATCGDVLKSVYNLLLNVNGDFSSFSGKVIDIHQFLAKHPEIIKTENLVPEKKIKITYHDPCHLKRGMNVHSEPREILKAIPWVDFIEMEDADACCGGAGGFSLKHYDLSLEIGKRKAESIKETGADIVVTGCPSCQMHISDILNHAGHNRPVFHTVELLNPEFLAGFR